MVIRTAHLDSLMAFYRDVLGCPVERELPDLGLHQLRAGAALIDLVDVAKPLGQMGGAAPGAEGRNMDHFCLQVAPWDADAIKAHLLQAGVAIGDEGIRYGAQGDGPSIYIKDPDGNTVELKGPPEA